MTFFHFVNCVALSYAPYVLAYKYSGLNEYSSMWRCIQAAIGYFLTQLIKLLLLATFFPAGESEGFSVIPELLKSSADVVDVIGMYVVMNNFLSGKGEMVFELRGKPFALREDRNCTEYQLCRAWMRGKLNDDDRPPPPPPADPRVSTCDLAPSATSPYAVDSQFPDRKDLDVFNKELDPANLEVLRKEYARHWKSVKRTWKSHTRLRAQRYHRTTALLETIFTIAQQNHD